MNSCCLHSKKRIPDLELVNYLISFGANNFTDVIDSISFFCRFLPFEIFKIFISQILNILNLKRRNLCVSKIQKKFIKSQKLIK